MRRAALFALLLLWVSPAFAAIVSEHPDKVTLTIYQDEEVSTVEFAKTRNDYLWQRDGIAFVTETRTIDLPAGPSEIEFRSVMSTIVPQTADVEGLPAGVLERNFDYNLLSPGSLLAKSVGQTVQLARTDPKNGKTTEKTAVVRAAPAGTLLEIDGKLEALHCSGLPEKLVFEKIPEGLRDTPTLSVRAFIPAAGRYTVTLSYIATGLYWSADYNAIIRPDGRSLDLNGWITLANFSSSTYRQVAVEAVAGRVFATHEDEPVAPSSTPLSAGCWPTNIDWASVRQMIMAGNRLAAAPPPPPPPPAMAVESVVVTGGHIDPRKLGDYKLYPLPELTDVASHQTKQVQFLAQAGVPFERLYIYEIDPYDRARDHPATVLLRLHNTEADGLGKPLPAGAVSVTEAAFDGSPVLLGQHSVHDTPTGLPMEIETGHAIDVRVDRREIATQTLGHGKDERSRTTYEFVIENNKSIPIRFELTQPQPDGAQIVSEDQPHVMKPRGFTWSFDMAPHDRKAMHYAIEQPDS